MEQTLQALGGILIKAIPTTIALVFLHFFFRIMLFGPIRKMLKQREELTAGARRAAQASQAEADRRAAEYEIQFRDARGTVYKEQEEIRRRWLADQAEQVAAARSSAENTVKQAKFEIASEAASARQNLLETSAGLADQIATAVLGRRAQ
jgi:F-type H+-transporting ATPase subunit b